MDQSCHPMTWPAKRNSQRTPPPVFQKRRVYWYSWERPGSVSCPPFYRQIMGQTGYFRFVEARKGKLWIEPSFTSLKIYLMFWSWGWILMMLTESLNKKYILVHKTYFNSFSWYKKIYYEYLNRAFPRDLKIKFPRSHILPAEFSIIKPKFFKVSL